MSADGVNRAGMRRSHEKLLNRLLLAVALVTAIAVCAARLGGIGSSIETASVHLRFELRGASRPHSAVIVAIDNRTLNALRRRWPFPRSLDAAAIDRLHADRARAIVYDVQFTQPTVAREDLSLYESVARARGVVLATTESGPHGQTNVLGGDANLARARAEAAAANFRANSSGTIERYARSIGGLRSMAVAGAERASGHHVPPSAFEHGSALIDFAGPAGSIPTVSFSDLLKGAVDPSLIAGKIVIVGATSPVLQDYHATSVTSGSGMPGPEVQANAILTALHGNPLREAPGWLELVAIVLAAAIAPLVRLRTRLGGALLAGVAFGVAYALLAQVAFDADLVVSLVYPLLATALSVLGVLGASYCVERWERRLAELYGAELEAAVRERTTELRETQREVVQRLAQAAELRDDDTGAHVERVGRMCSQLAIEAGMSAEEAERLRLASALHDVGKIGVPDRVLLKAGELSDAEWAAMRAHTSTGAALLAGSSSPLLQMAEEIALTHHERWDGTGYPNGLRGEEIPLVGRICAVCDVFDALASRRPYKEPWPVERIVAEIERKRGTQFDPAIVDAFLRLLERWRGAPDAPFDLPLDREVAGTPPSAATAVGRSPLSTRST